MTDCSDVRIRFKHGDFGKLRHRLLSDLSQEHFALLLGCTRTIDDIKIINVIDIRFLDPDDYVGQSISHLKLNKELIVRILVEILNRHDVDSIIDVHTHPFSKDRVAFSGVDDNDERNFAGFLEKKFEGLHYASIVLSQNSYAARYWYRKKRRIRTKNCDIETQTLPEIVPNSAKHSERPIVNDAELIDPMGFYNRSLLALGLDTMRSLTSGQTISVVGAGGLGSIIAESLVHTGFTSINIIDFDNIEHSNLNRIVGAHYNDADEGNLKVDVIKNHLEAINPSVSINALPFDVHHIESEKHIANSNWLIVATDNHSSRFKSQEISLRYFVPLISVGVNITVENSIIKDMSGEVIVARVGDNLCLNCLGRLNQTKIHYELHPDQSIKQYLADKGYVEGADVKQPAVKTLNSFLANIAVETLVNQYTQRQRHRAITVFENNLSMCIYEDRYSVNNRFLNCFHCNV